MYYLTTHSTHFIYGYMVSDMVKDHSDSEKGNPLPPHRLLFLINSKGSCIYTTPGCGRNRAGCAAVLYNIHILLITVLRGNIVKSNVRYLGGGGGGG